MQVLVSTHFGDRYDGQMHAEDPEVPVPERKVAPVANVIRIPGPTLALSSRTRRMPVRYRR